MKLKTRQSLFCEVAAIIPILQMRKLELRKVNLVIVIQVMLQFGFNLNSKHFINYCVMSTLRYYMGGK